MGLDAVVYCDCFEAGRLREPPPPAWQLFVDECGSIECKSDELSVLLAFDQWREFRACNHEGNVLIHHYLGNIATIGALEAELRPASANLPIMLGKVLYSATHCGDFLTLSEIGQLQSELDAVKDHRAITTEMDRLLRHFCSQMAELANCALRVGKPISF